MKNDDFWDDVFGGAYWLSTSVYAHGGGEGCLFAFAIFAWFLLIPVIVSGASGIDIDSFVPFWYLIITPIAAIIVYGNHLNREDEYKDHIRTLRDEYLSITSTMSLTKREKDRRHIFITSEESSSFEKEQEAWRKKFADRLIDEHLEYERNQGIKISAKERVAEQRDIWVTYRVGHLFPKYAELTQFWVPSFNELHQMCNKKLSRRDKLRSMVYLKAPPRGDFDPFMGILRDVVSDRTESLAYKHAELEYDQGTLIPINPGEMSPENCIYPPTKPIDDHYIEEVFYQAKDEEHERIAYVDLSSKEVICPYCGTSNTNHYPFCFKCDAEFRRKCK